ncbi:MAG: sulfur carrier protein ThiS [Acidimicrobiales bacterium]
MSNVVTLVVNGEPQEVPAGTTVAGVIAFIAPSTRGIAVALNGGIVARSTWESTPVAAGDHIEVLTAAQGG